MDATAATGQLARIGDDPSPAAAAFGKITGLSGHMTVLPSAFNPPTLAHFELLRLGLEPGSVAAALLTTRNVDKGITGAGLEHRLGMLLAEQIREPWFAVLATNQARIIDQERALAASFPDTEWDFVLGFDTLVRLFDTRYYSDMPNELAPFFERSRVIALNRGEHSITEVREFVASSAPAFTSRIVVRELPQYPASLSSTLARVAVAGDAEAPVPPAVAEYIQRHRLYRA